MRALVYDADGVPPQCAATCTDTLRPMCASWPTQWQRRAATRPRRAATRPRRAATRPRRAATRPRVLAAVCWGEAREVPQRRRRRRRLDRDRRATPPSPSRRIWRRCRAGRPHGAGCRALPGRAGLATLRGSHVQHTTGATHGLPRRGGCPVAIYSDETFILMKRVRVLFILMKRVLGE